MARTAEYVRLGLRVPKEVGDYWKGRRLASKMLTEASMPMIQENGESLASVTTRLKGLLEEDRVFHEADIRRHAEINILQQRIQLAGGQMLAGATIEAKVAAIRERYLLQTHVKRRAGAEPTKKQVLDWVRQEFRENPILHERFPTPEDLLHYLETNTRT